MKFFGIFLLILNFAFWAFVSWGKSLHPIADTYQTLYIFRAVAEGQVLYRDVSYFFGPFAPYFHGWLFRVFGIHLDVLRVVSLAIAASGAALLYMVVNRLIKEKFAWLATFVFINIFAFQNIQFTRLFNFVFPYNFSSTYATIFLLMALSLQVMISEKMTACKVVAWGCVVAMLGLNRFELCVVYSGFASLWIVGRFRSKRRELLSILFGFLATQGIILIVVYGYFISLAGWDGVVTQNIFWFGHIPSKYDEHQAEIFGLTSKGVKAIVLVSFVQGLALLPFLKQLGLGGRIGGWLENSYAIWFLASLVACYYLIAPDNVFANWQLLLITLGVWAMLRSQKGPGFLFLFFLWSLSVTMIARIFFGLQVTSYLFYLGVVPLIAIFCFIERILLSTPSHQRVRAFSYVALFCVLSVIRVSQESYKNYQFTSLKVETQYGDFYIPPSTAGYSIHETISALTPLPRYVKSLLVLPEGSIFNFLTGLEHPTYNQTFLPHMIRAYGEDALIEKLSESPPDAVILLHRYSPEFGDENLFTVNYGEKISEWLSREYVDAVDIGPAPFSIANWDAGGARILLRAKLLGGQVSKAS